MIKSHQVLFGSIIVLLASSGGILFTDALAVDSELFTKITSQEDYVDTNSYVIKSEFVSADLNVL